MKSYKIIFSCLIIGSMLIWNSCDQATSSHDNTPPLNNQTQDNITLAKATKKDPELVPGRYIVVYKDQGNRQISKHAAEVARQRTDAIFSELSIKKDSLIHQYSYALKGFAAKLTTEQVQALKRDSRVEAIVQDVRYKAIQMMPSSSSNVSNTLMSQSTPWGITRVGGPFDGTGKKAWVLDTGIDLDHADLNVDVSNSVSFVAGESADDGHGHGTHVAGTIAAKDNSTGVVGVAADADVVAVKVCNSSGECYTSDLDAGVDYIVSNYSSGDVANISLGWPITGNSRVDLALSVMENTIETAADNGLMFAIAAGNESQDANNKSPARIEYNNVWTVSAHDDNDDFAWFSNYGNPPIEYSNPGVDIPSLWRNGGTNTISGTSMAAPHIAGLLLANGNNIFTDGTVSNDADSNPDEIAVGRIPAPHITASVSNDRPKLDWNTVDGAQSYNIYRRFESGSWSLITNVTGTTFTDVNVVNPNLHVITSPPWNYEDFYSYRVHAVPASGPSSVASNYRYFSYEECTGPGCAS
ncbi:MAG: S8 family serine peptidase [Gracilimonas sp.]|uniref:S8 family serine peptidase n=1 Tax=Gracilimonas sp. TaxID=1974203 RepID=UPI003751C52A|nr:S8 family serine peptidase [Gracilimonas sp.]